MKSGAYLKIIFLVFTVTILVVGLVFGLKQFNTDLSDKNVTGNLQSEEYGQNFKEFDELNSESELNIDSLDKYVCDPLTEKSDPILEGTCDLDINI